MCGHLPSLLASDLSAIVYTVGVGDAEAIPDPAASLLEQLVSGAWADLPEARQLAQHAVATFAQRSSDYK